MGYQTIFYVPESQAPFLGRAAEVAEMFWGLGVFVETEDGFVGKRMAECKARGQPIPESVHNFTHSSIAIADYADPIPVPYRIWDLACPHCGADVLDHAYGVWGTESDTLIPQREVKCPSCGTASSSSSLKSEDPFTFASFYLSVTDVDEDDWEPSFKSTVETVLGPTREYQVWDT